MDAKKYKNLIFAVVAIVAAAIFIWQVVDKNGSDNNQTQTPSSSQKTNSEVSYEGSDSKNALALLKASHKTETKSYKGIGELVISIDGVKADSQHFWSFYVNGKQSQVGASSYTTKDGDKITWKLEDIK